MQWRKNQDRMRAESVEDASMNILSTLKDRSCFDTPIVDAHHHLWDLNAGRYPTKQDKYDPNFFLGDDRKIRRDRLPKGIVDVMLTGLADRPREDLEKLFPHNAIRSHRINL
jgi:hypothetical protein